MRWKEKRVEGGANGVACESMAGDKIGREGSHDSYSA